MPILLDAVRSARHNLAGKILLNEPAGGPAPTSDDKCIDIGLLNIMPDAALESTERQFLTLLNAAADDCLIRVSFFSMPEVPRSERAQSYLSQSYLDARSLRDADLDALIVTGTEPKAANLMDEPYWAALTNVIDWAEQHTISTVWSCLAAHAAVLYLDDIERQPVGTKCSGVFDFTTVGGHPIANSLPSRIQIPHSRYNELPEQKLTSAGYRVLSKSANAGVDTFIKQSRSLFLFFQGHPEYEAQTLLGEYRRDIGRFLRCERDTYPNMPQGYFDDATAELMTAFRAQAQSNRNEELLAQFPSAATELKLSNTWRPFAAAMYRNWLSYIAAQKAR
jgi:homoserine O-succinyltransferase/O-acetyltransferase